MTHPANLAVEEVVVNSIINQPRSQQTRIGPSEIGTDCVRCLARKLAGIPKIKAEGVADVPWLPFLGTGMHSMLEDFFRAENERLGTERWLVEERLTIGKIGEQVITGSCDLFDTVTHTVIDHKLVGSTKLTKVSRSNDPGNTYRIQAHLYGYGWIQKGYEVADVAVKFYPRNNISLQAGYFWSEPYNEKIALDAMARANNIYKDVTLTDDMPAYLLTLPTSNDCFSCVEYPSLEVQEVAYVDDLFTQPTPFNKR
jgi:hypothetical protein